MTHDQKMLLVIISALFAGALVCTPLKKRYKWTYWQEFAVSLCVFFIIMGMFIWYFDLYQNGPVYKWYISRQS